MKKKIKKKTDIDILVWRNGHEMEVADISCFQK